MACTSASENVISRMTGLPPRLVAFSKPMGVPVLCPLCHDEPRRVYLHLNQPAPPPTRFNLALPRDLETVCLKCLEKDPARRYSDCQALADDLRCWLEGEPIRARRAGLPERAVRWARK